MQHLVLFLFGGFLVSLGDRVHIAFGVLTQQDRSFFGQAWWVIPVFGLACAALPPVYTRLRGAFGAPPVPRDIVRTALATLAFLAAYAATGPYGDAKLGLTLALVALWGVRFSVRRRAVDALVCGLMAIVGPLGEASFSALGLFAYQSPDLLGVPAWLPGIYLHAGLLVPEIEAWMATERKVPVPAATG